MIPMSDVNKPEVSKAVGLIYEIRGEDEKASRHGY